MKVTLPAMHRRRLLKWLAASLLPGSAGAAGNIATAATSVEPAAPPRFILCLLGPEGWLSTVARRVEAFGHGFTLDREYSLETSDERMPTSFAASWDRAPPSHTEKDRDAMSTHGSVAYVLSQELTQEASVDTGVRALDLIDALFEDGALACKCDTAGVAHGAKRWRTLAARLRESDRSDRRERGAILYRAFVRRPLSDEGVLYSCGMHQLGYPDIEYLGPRDELAATDLIDRAAKAVLAGDRVDLPHAPCSRYEGDFFFYNPYGYLRIEEAD